MTDTTKRQTPPALTRRRMISISAASAALLLPGLAEARAERVVWRGVALGAEAQIQLAHRDEKRAARVLKHCVAEINRLEDIFSLYRRDSALNRLNRDGQLLSPDMALVELVATALQISRETEGAFDVSVQPLWTLYAGHFSTPGADHAGPGEKQIRQALERIGYQHIRLSTQRIALERRGMALTLNGIAQGFITDAISALLNQHGFFNVLVHLGETFGAGTKPDGTPWRAGIAATDGSGALLKKINLQNRALATSGGYGHMFAAGGQHHHLFDPHSGLSAQRYKSVSVIAPAATTADALSTAFTNMSLESIEKILTRRTDTFATIVRQDGRMVEM